MSVLEEPAFGKVDPGELFYCCDILDEGFFGWFRAGQPQVFSNSNDDFAQQGDSLQFYLPDSFMLDVWMPRNVRYDRFRYNRVFADQVKAGHCQQLLIVGIEKLNDLVTLQVPLKEPVLVGSKQESVELLLLGFALRRLSSQIFVAK